MARAQPPVRRLAWATDLHFEHAVGPAADRFYQSLQAARPDALLLTGDIADSPRLLTQLIAIADQVSCPVYVTLGNHDFYYGGVAEVRAAVRGLQRRRSQIRYLTDAGVVSLSDTTALVGTDGWADMRVGRWAFTTKTPGDFQFINDFRAKTRQVRVDLVRDFADQSAAQLERDVAQALATHTRVIVGTHLPPFHDLCATEDRAPDLDVLPHLVCAAVGEVLVRAAEVHLDRSIGVLCGHTHAGRTVAIRPTLYARTGAVVYGTPTLQDVLGIT